MLPAHYNKKETNYFCRFTFGQFFTLLVLEIFTLFFIFYLGARYGGELLGVKPPPTPVAGQEGLPKVTSTDPNVVTTTQDPEIRAMAKDLLKQAPSTDLKQRVSQMLEESSARKASPPPPPSKPVAVVTAAPPKTEPKPEMEKPKPVIQTMPANAAFSIQVGSYPNVDEAHNMVDHWKAKGYPAYLVSADIPGKGRWYRVRVGGFETKDTAQAYLNKLTTKESIEAFVVTNE